MRPRPQILLNPTLTAVMAFVCMLAITESSAAQPAQPQNNDAKTPAMLTDDDINLIKVYEVPLRSNPAPRVDIPRKVLEEFLEEYREDDRLPRGKGDQADWLRKDGHEQLAVLFELRARSYYKHVRVKSQIPALREWGAMHRRYILGYFREHFGDGDVPGVYLFDRGRDRDRIEMTNFYILTQTEIDGKPMIDRDNPSESLLIQWGLPREDAKYAAPQIKSWQPYFKSADDKRLTDMVKWIESMERANQGSTYGLTYQIPGKTKPNAAENAKPDAAE